MQKLIIEEGIVNGYLEEELICLHEFLKTGIYSVDPFKIDDEIEEVKHTLENYFKKKY